MRRANPGLVPVVAILSIAGASIARAIAGPAAGQDSDYKARFDAAIALHDGGKYEAAIAAFRDLLAARPDDPTLLCELANSCLAAGRFEEAIDRAKHGLARPGADRAACSSIVGSALDGLGELGKGEKFFRKAIKESPRAALLHFNLGINLGQQNRIDDAIPEFQEAIRLNPAYASSWRALAIAWMQSGRRPRAFAAFARFLTLEPTGTRAESAAKRLRALLFQGVENKGIDPATGKQGVDITIDPGTGRKEEATGALDAGMSIVAAGRWLEEWDDRPDGEFFAHAFESVMTIFEEVGADGKEDAFWRESVLPYFRDAHAAGHLVAMAWDIRRSLQDAEITAWLEAHAEQVENYRAWSAAWKPAADQGERAH